MIIFKPLGCILNPLCQLCHADKSLINHRRQTASVDSCLSQSLSLPLSACLVREPSDWDKSPKISRANTSVLRCLTILEAQARTRPPSGRKDKLPCVTSNKGGQRLWRHEGPHGGAESAVTHWKSSHLRTLF